MEKVEAHKEARTSYQPQKKARAWLSRAMEHINSVSYKVSGRWVSYRLLQDGLIESKDNFKQFEEYMGSARKAMYEEWTPFTLSDSIRETLREEESGHGPKTYDPEQLAKDNMAEIGSFYVYVPRWYFEDYYAEVWFEARAMTGQFELYVPRGVTLQPCGGDLSIPMKAEGAKRLLGWSEELSKPSIILYYGDYDPKGLQIPASIATELYAWCPSATIYRVGLLEEHIERFNLPENPENPGKYQWEALSDEQAEELILEGINEILSPDAPAKARAEERRIENQARDVLSRELREYLNTLD